MGYLVRLSKDSVFYGMMQKISGDGYFYGGRYLHTAGDGEQDQTSRKCLHVSLRFDLSHQSKQCDWIRVWSKLTLRLKYFREHTCVRPAVEVTEHDVVLINNVDISLRYGMN